MTCILVATPDPAMHLAFQVSMFDNNLQCISSIEFHNVKNFCILSPPHYILCMVIFILKLFINRNHKIRNMLVTF